jgi:hypothetical protein
MTRPLPPDLGGPAPHHPAAGEAPTTRPTDPHPALAGGGANAVTTKAVIPAFAGLAFARVANRVTRHPVMSETVATPKSGNQQGYRTLIIAHSQVRYPTGLPDPSFISARFFLQL